MSTFIVYYGAITPDNYDASEGDGPYKLVLCKTEAQVLKLRKEHEEERGPEDSKPIFRVFRGEELTLEPVKTVTEWVLRSAK